METEHTVSNPDSSNNCNGGDSNMGFGSGEGGLALEAAMKRGEREKQLESQVQ